MIISMSFEIQSLTTAHLHQHCLQDAVSCSYKCTVSSVLVIENKNKISFQVISSEFSFCHLIHPPATAQLFSTMYFLRALLMYSVFYCNFCATIIHFLYYRRQRHFIGMLLSLGVLSTNFFRYKYFTNFFWSLNKDFGVDDCLTVHLVCPIPQLPLALSISTPFVDLWCIEVNVKIPVNLLMI